MAAGLARGAADRGKQIAFGDGRKLIWDQNSEQIFRFNPNICPPGRERQLQNVEWVPFYKGHRIYNRQEKGRWCWNYEFKAIPGEIFLSRNEKSEAETHGSGFVLIEPNASVHKSVALNKQWPVDRFDAVARLLRDAGHEVVQLRYGNGSGHRIPHARQITTLNFRNALAVMKNSALYIGSEGGLHHGAAAVNRPAVVLFGGFIPPQVTGYDTHVNLTGGSEACGSITKCEHCQQALKKISVEEVFDAAKGSLSGLLSAEGS